MSEKGYKLVASITTDNPEKIEPVLARLVGVDAILKTESGFMVRTIMHGGSAHELNRTLLSKLSLADENVTLKAEWTHERITEGFNDSMSLDKL